MRAFLVAIMIVEALATMADLRSLSSGEKSTEYTPAARGWGILIQTSLFVWALVLWHSVPS